MNYIFRYIVIIVLLASIYNVEAQTSKPFNDTNNNYIKRSFNISGSICLGQEIGINGSLEYENKRWGKVILRPQFSYLHSEMTSYDGKFIDLALGYGVRALKRNRHHLYINIYGTYFTIISKYNKIHGHSFILELEYKLKLKHNYLVIAPYYRVAEIKYTNSNSVHSIDGFLGVRIGIAHNFELKN